MGHTLLLSGVVGHTLPLPHSGPLSDFFVNLPEHSDRIDQVEMNTITMCDRSHTTIAMDGGSHTSLTCVVGGTLPLPHVVGHT